jgi:tetratricopeptide (TPR) repeat protein
LELPGNNWAQCPALEAFQRALAEFQNSPAAGSSEIAIYVSLVMTYRDTLGDLEKAQETAQTALEKAPTSADPIHGPRPQRPRLDYSRAR